MAAVAVADIGTIHGVSHEDIGEIIMQRCTRLEKSDFGEGSADVASNG